MVRELAADNLRVVASTNDRSTSTVTQELQLNMAKLEQCIQLPKINRLMLRKAEKHDKDKMAITSTFAALERFLVQNGIEWY